ncbi:MULTISPECIES: rhodanese-like domain-containing protein [unclassified Sphingomonas]|uniref:rhodanese-like domain-containing protein n=1 Tax=unclassified Sphingomonas TaxID=196159 RepID=UPI002150F501|nr:MULTISPECIES: rhodanese-like domain-containing protein [unclassified Sphingomonas]MCR5870110.1 rhodanese-like domain-containing protein [Sphingomonas sp. J344]UUX98198.1 rhodanese-like domain-containing protein [Sphingomonas sp. J315]
MHRRLFLITLGATAATPALAQRKLPQEPNPQIDYGGFEQLTGDVRRLRAQRLLPFAKFKEQAASRGTVLLDARSETAFREGHIRGAANLPLPDFNAESLRNLIGRDRKRMVLIYCNNNFSNRVRPVPMKAAPLALNIQTFINLVGYGYSNVWELADVIDFDDPKVEWVRGLA